MWGEPHVCRRHFSFGAPALRILRGRQPGDSRTIARRQAWLRRLWRLADQMRAACSMRRRSWGVTDSSAATCRARIFTSTKTSKFSLVAIRSISQAGGAAIDDAITPALEPTREGVLGAAPIPLAQAAEDGFLMLLRHQRHCAARARVRRHRGASARGFRRFRRRSPSKGGCRRPRGWRRRWRWLRVAPALPAGRRG